MRRFSAGALATDADRRAIEQAALRDYPDNQVERFLGHSFSFDNTSAQKMTIKVRWLGYDRTHDPDDPVTSLVEDVPDLVEKYLRANANAHEAACARMFHRYLFQMNFPYYKYPHGLGGNYGGLGSFFQSFTLYKLLGVL